MKIKKLPTGIYTMTIKMKNGKKSVVVMSEKPTLYQRFLVWRQSLRFRI